jgi:diacylglycerol kinase (ATP)
LLLAPDGVGLALMIGSVLLVLIVELLNSAIEAVRRPGFARAAPLGQARQGYRQRGGPLALLNVLVVWACVLLG